MKYIIRDNQAGFVLKNGVFQKMITAGTYHFSKMAGYTVAVQEMLGEMDYLEVPYQVLAKDAAFLNATVHTEIPDGFAGFIYMNGKLTSFATRKDYVFWNVFDKYEVRSAYDGNGHRRGNDKADAFAGACTSLYRSVCRRRGGGAGIL